MTEDSIPGADFGFPAKKVEKEQIVGVFDLVGFTSMGSNKALVRAVDVLETEMGLILGPHFHWGEMDKRELESARNDILLISTGDGYAVVFSEGMNDPKALQYLVELHNAIRKRKFNVTLGIHKGKNYIVDNANKRVNVIGWGINMAVRAQQIAQPNQILCTEYFAKPLLSTEGDPISDKVMIDIGKHKAKKTNIHLFNYYKKGTFGAPFKASQ